MPLEQSHGRARPTLPRSGDLPAVPAEHERSRQRDAKGRWVAGNAGGNGRGWRAAVAKMIGRELKGEAAPLARESFRMYRALLAELPHDGAQVSSLVASRARSAVVAARYFARAAELGLDTDEGRAALELSMRLDQRAERLAVTALDVATRLATADRKRRPEDAHAGVVEAFGVKATKGAGS